MGRSRSCSSKSVCDTGTSHHFNSDIKFNKNYLPNLISVIYTFYADPSHLLADVAADGPCSVILVS